MSLLSLLVLAGSLWLLAALAFVGMCLAALRVEAAELEGLRSARRHRSWRPRQGSRSRGGRTSPPPVDRGHPATG
jgi:hypothetical protein